MDGLVAIQLHPQMHALAREERERHLRAAQARHAAHWTGRARRPCAIRRPLWAIYRRIRRTPVPQPHSSSV